MVNRVMRLLVMFDLPVATPKDRKQYSQFHKYLIKSGYFMVQFSVYTRVALNHDDARAHIKRLRSNLPPKGSVRVLQVTEKQYNAMDILVGEKTAQEDFLTPKDILEI